MTDDGHLHGTSAGCCTAALNVSGEHFQCDLALDHNGWAHSNQDAQAIWTNRPDAPTPTPADGDRQEALDALYRLTSSAVFAGTQYPVTVVAWSSVLDWWQTLAARPSAPTVTTEKDRAAAREADAEGFVRGTIEWRRNYLDALGIEVQP